MLVKAKEDAVLKNEKARIPKKHTFAPLPGFHGREKEQGKYAATVLLYEKD